MLKPFCADSVRKMFHREVRESHIKAVSGRTGSQHTYFYRTIDLHPRVAHHDVFLVVKGIEDCYRILSVYGLDPDKIHRLVEGDDTPVGCVVGHHGAEVEFAVYIFYSGFDIVLMVDANHQTSLVEAYLIIARDLHLCLNSPPYSA